MTTPYQTYLNAQADYAAALELGDAALIIETRSVMDEAHRESIIGDRKAERAMHGYIGGRYVGATFHRSGRRHSCAGGMGMHINGSASAPCPRPW
jgi:hypothetical protein